MNRLDDGELVQLTEPVNKFPTFVRYSVQRLKVLCPSLGKVKIAEILARAGLHLGATTVGRIVKEPPHARETSSNIESKPDALATVTDAAKPVKKKRIVTANYVNHVWHVDLTTVPTSLGYWVAWLPFAVPLRWPFAWWVAIVVDQYSRRVLGQIAFFGQPTSQQVRQFLGIVMHQQQAQPKHLISDSGTQFKNSAYKHWCAQHGIKPRFGAVAQHGSIAIIERFILSLKNECTRRILVQFHRPSFREELARYLDWFNEHRPHMSLDGLTPNEVYFDRKPANRRPRIEPRDRWPRGSPCAKPQVLVQGTCVQKFELVVRFQDGRRHLPLVSLKKVAA